VGPRKVNPAPSGQPLCIIGDPAEFLVTDATLTTPEGGNPNWILEIQTNYGVPLSGTIIPEYFSLKSTVLSGSAIS